MNEGEAIRARTRAWWRGRPRLPVLLLFGVVAVGLVGGVFLIANTIRAERIERGQATRTEEMVTILADINRAAVNAETGQRGYYITLDRRYLAPYEAARAQLPPLIARLQRQVRGSGTPQQQALAADLETLASAKLAELDETVTQIGLGDRDSAERRILSDDGEHLMERLRATITRMAAIETARLREIRAASVATEQRIIPLLALLLGLIVATLALGLWQVFRAARLEASEAQAADLRSARDRADLLASELNHRVKNLFAVVLAIVRMSGREHPEGREAIDRLGGRIEALSKAHGATQGSPQYRTAQLDQLVETALAPYRSDASACTIEGPETALPQIAVVPLGLVLHELATNAVKYGGWSRPGGSIAVSWTHAEADGAPLCLRWREHSPAGAKPPRLGKEGFGSALVESAARQLGGSFEREFHDNGIELRLSFPLTR